MLGKGHDIDDNAEKTCKLHQSANLKITSFYSIKTLLLSTVGLRLIYMTGINSLADYKR